MGKRVVQYAIDILIDDDSLVSETTLHEALHSYEKDFMCEILGVGFSEDLTNEYKNTMPFLFEDNVENNTPEILYFSPTVSGEKICFDDFILNEDGEIYWSGLCENCREKYKVNDYYVDKNVGSGICGVMGCNNEADHYIDMLMDECEIRKD